MKRCPVTGDLLIRCACGACDDLDGLDGPYLVPGDGSDEDEAGT